MRTSTYTKAQAEAEVKRFITLHPGEYTTKVCRADCRAYPCPDELDGWDGEVQAITVEDAQLNEVYSCAFWTEEEE